MEEEKKMRPADGSGERKRRVHRYPEQQKRRRPADGNGERKRRSADETGSGERRRSSAQRRRTPESARGAEHRRRSSAETRSAQTRSSRNRSRSSARQRTAGSPIPYFGTIMFLIFLAIYIIVFVLIVRGMIGKSKVYLAEREESHSSAQIDDYISKLTDGFYTDMVKSASANVQLSQYETAELLENAAAVDPDDSAKYTYQKTEDYTETRPNYYILRNGEAIATVPLERTGWTKEYSLPLWQVGTPVSIMDVSAKPAYTVVITAPSDATVKLNGVEIAEDLYTDADSELKLTATELMYMNQPTSKSCQIGGLFVAPKVEAVDSAGRPLTPEKMPESNAAVQEYVFPHANEPEPDAALVERVEKLTYAYMDYVINTHCTVEANLAVLSQYMLPGSDFAQLMQHISGDVWYNNDPNMREDHEIDIPNVRMYADTLCTVDVHIETTIGKVAVNDYIVTIRFVMVNNGYGWLCSDFELFPT